MKRNHLLYVLLVCVCCMQASIGGAQDPHFSQYFTSPMTVNPALIGKEVGDWRAIGTFRSQWWGGAIAPFTTTSASLEKNFRSGVTGKSMFGIGISLLTDASNSGLLKNNYFSGGFAYNIALDAEGKELLGVGLEGTYANRLLDASKFSFQSQFGSMGFQRSAPSGDPVSVLSNKYWDVSTGLHYSKRYKTGGINLGIAIFHAGKPKEGVFSNNTYSVDRRVSLQTGIRFNLKNKDEIHFSGIADLQGQNSIYTLGGVYKAKLNTAQLKSFNIGIWNRFNDALYPYIALESKNWLLGISYDVINTDIRNSFNSVQSIELSLTCLFGAKRNPAKRREVVVIY